MAVTTMSNQNYTFTFILFIISSKIPLPQIIENYNPLQALLLLELSYIELPQDLIDLRHRSADI